MDLSILTIFFKEEKELLINFMNSICRSIDNISFEIILINNGKEKLDFLKVYKNLIIIENEKNAGVAKARNQSYYKSQGRVILFIDSDVIVEGEAIEKMYKYLINHPEIGVVAPKIVYPGGRLQYNFGSLPSRKYLFYEMPNISIPTGKGVVCPQLTDFLSGCCLMLKKDIWEKVGPFDENFFPYGWEDADWCRRAKEKGIRLFYFPEVKIVHFAHQSSKRTGARQVDFYLSGIYYYKKHFGKTFAFIAKLFIIAFSFLRIGVTFFKRERRKTRKLCWRLIKLVIIGFSVD